jgi:hypothetical protein
MCCAAINNVRSQQAESHLNGGMAAGRPTRMKKRANAWEKW